MSKYCTYLDAVVPTPFRVLGVQLRPLCLGHLLLLERIESPYVGSENVEAKDLMLAVLLCSKTFEAGCALVSSAYGLSEEMASWQRMLRGGWFRRRKIDWVQANQLFGEYLEDGQRRADVWQRQHDGPSMTAPWQEIVSVTLTRTGWTESEIMNCYMPRLWVRYYTALELRMFETAQKPEHIERVFVSDDEHEKMNAIRNRVKQQYGENHS